MKLLMLNFQYIVSRKYVVLIIIQVLLPTNNNVEQKYDLYWSGHAAKRQHGVGIAIKVDEGIEIEKITPVSARIIVANLLLYGCSLRDICCYAPIEEDSDSSKNIFYSKLNKQFERSSVLEISIPTRQLLGINRLFEKMELLKIS